MSEAPAPGWLEQLEADSRKRFVRWDQRLWGELLEGPAARLDAALASGGGDEESAGKVMRSYLELAAQGVGLGLLFPAQAGASSFFTQAWTDLLPRLLPALPPRRQAEILATCWNIGENLESTEPWVGRILLNACRDLASLDDLEDRIDGVARRIFEPPGRDLSGEIDDKWVHLGEAEPRFLPGRIHFLAPTVACVHHRHSGGATVGSTCGVWLGDEPMLLGHVGCAEVLPDAVEPLAYIGHLRSTDPRFTEPFAWAANAWRGAITLVSSQFLIALVPR